jgi:hypothetical protein
MTDKTLILGRLDDLAENQMRQVEVAGPRR